LSTYIEQVIHKTFVKRSYHPWTKLSVVWCMLLQIISQGMVVIRQKGPKPHLHCPFKKTKVIEQHIASRVQVYRLLHTCS